MELLKEAKDLYYFSLNQSNNLNSKMSMSVTLLSIIGSANAFLFSKYFTEPINTIYLLLCFISLIIFVISIVQFYRAYNNYLYAYFPTEDISKWIYNSQATKLPNISDSCRNELLNKRQMDMFVKLYLKCAINNEALNTKKTARFRTFIILCFSSFISIAITYAFRLIFIENIHF